MRIIQVLTLISTSGDYGGPTRVALNQAQELSRRGHSVKILGGWRDRTSRPVEVDGVPVSPQPARQLIPGAGFSGLISVRLLHQIVKYRKDFDCIHVHCGRDLISITALMVARCLRIPTIVQTHGMVRPDNRIRARIMDRLLVRSLLRRANKILVLTRREELDVATVLRSPTANIERVGNGVPLSEEASWTAGNLPSDKLDVVFCARLHSRKRPLVFVEAAATLSHIAGLQFSIYGPDGGELASVQERISDLRLVDRVVYHGPIEYGGVLRRIAEADLYVLPSVNEPFPMSLLEAMSVGVACVTTDSCGIASDLQAEEAAVVTNGSISEIARAIEDLAGNKINREAIARRGQALVRSNYSMRAVGDRLENIYSGSIDSMSASRGIS